MKITLDQVESLRKRVECDYQTAEKVLRKTGGNEDQAVLLLLKRRDHKVRHLFGLLQELLRKVWNINLTLCRKNKVVLRIPIVLLGMGYVIFDLPMGFVLASVLVAIAAGYEFELEQRGGQGKDENDLHWNSSRKETKDEPAGQEASTVPFEENRKEGKSQVMQQDTPEDDSTVLQPRPEEPETSWDEVHEIVIE